MTQQNNFGCLAVRNRGQVRHLCPYNPRRSSFGRISENRMLKNQQLTASRTRANRNLRQILHTSSPLGGDGGALSHVPPALCPPSQGLIEVGSAVFSQPRSISATLQAWATHPRGVEGDSASKISLIEPRHASPRCGTSPSRKPRAPARSSGYTRSHASIKGPMSQGHTVP
jgi:hypothetical protein